MGTVACAHNSEFRKTSNDLMQKQETTHSHVFCSFERRTQLGRNMPWYVSHTNYTHNVQPTPGLGTKSNFPTPCAGARDTWKRKNRHSNITIGDAWYPEEITMLSKKKEPCRVKMFAFQWPDWTERESKVIRLPSAALWIRGGAIVPGRLRGFVDVQALRQDYTPN